jgi:preprotein translocase subunit SecA
MVYLREGISLRGYGQRDPLVEYQREGYDMFSAMMEGIKEESVGNLFNLQVQRQDSPIVEEAVPGGAFLSVPPDGAGPGGAVPAGGVQGGSGVVPAAGGQPDAGQPSSATRPPGRHSRSTASGGRQGARQRAGGQAQPPLADPGQDGPAVPAALAGRGLDRPQRPSRLQYTAPSEDGSGNAQQRSASADGTDYSKVGRNAPCPCGSGRKFKQCHGDPRNR